MTSFMRSVKSVRQIEHSYLLSSININLCPLCIFLFDHKSSADNLNVNNARSLSEYLSRIPPRLVSGELLTNVKHFDFFQYPELWYMVGLKH